MRTELTEANRAIRETNRTLKEIKLDREKERRGQEKADHAVQLTTMPELLGLYHALFLTLNVERNSSVLMAGEVCQPAGRRYPKRIVPWHNFANRQQEIWNTICASSTYSQQLFYSRAEMSHKKLEAVRSERNVGSNEEVAVLQPVQDILRQFFKDGVLRRQLRLPGYAIAFRSRLNHDLESQDASTSEDVGGQAEKIFVFQLENGREIPVYNIAYKPTFMFSAEHILQGLQGEILLARDVINKEDKSREFNAKRLGWAVITQLFSCMIKTGVQYGYVSTGDMIIFLHISEDPDQIEFHVWNPQDFDFHQPASLHHTAIAEVLAFSLQALAAKPPFQGFHDAVASPTTWAVKSVDIFKNIPEIDEKRRVKRDLPGYKSSRPKNSSYWESQESPSHRVHRSKVARAENKRKTDRDGTAGSDSGDSRKRATERDYCSPKCLLGLANGGNLDPDCPNIADHAKRHLKRLDFLRLVREQLARDCGLINECEPLLVGGSRGAMFKVSLTSHGYTVIAKGVQRFNVRHLEHEALVYRHLRSLQGTFIPVCLGSTDLVLPYYHMGGQFVCFLFQSYAGVSVSQVINKENKQDILSKITHAMEAIHRFRVLHCDALPRNIMADENSGWVQIIDFERAKIEEKMVRKNLLWRARSANGRFIRQRPAGQNGKKSMEMGDYYFSRELRIALSSTERCLS